MPNCWKDVLTQVNSRQEEPFVVVIRKIQQVPLLKTYRLHCEGESWAGTEGQAGLAQVEDSWEEHEAFLTESKAKAGDLQKEGQSCLRGDRESERNIQLSTNKSNNEYLLNAYHVPGSVLTALSVPEEHPGICDPSGTLPGHRACHHTIPEHSPGSADVSGSYSCTFCGVAHPNMGEN